MCYTIIVLCKRYIVNNQLPSTWFAIIRWKFKSLVGAIACSLSVPHFRRWIGKHKATTGAENAEKRRTLMPRLRLLVSLIKRISFTFNKYFSSTLAFSSSPWPPPSCLLVIPLPSFCTVFRQQQVLLTFLHRHRIYFHARHRTHVKC